eukprot:1122595-Lingulodinium_polyedra.AAC.1
MSFNTANGVAHVDEGFKVNVDVFASTAKPYILNNTPNVLSASMRCVQQGFAFIWPARENPYFILPDDRV